MESAAMQPIVTLTLNPAIDASTTVEHVLAEHKLRCTEPHREPGGGGINVSRAVGKLGGASLALYLSGGPPGQMLQELLDREGLVHHRMAIAGWTRESLTVLEETTGRQFRFNMPGPALQAAEWQQCFEHLAALDPKPGYLVASGSLPPGVPDDFYAQVARTGNAMGARVIVDTSGEALCHAANEQLYLIKPNLRELGMLLGHPFIDEDEVETAAADLVAGGRCEAVVVSLGAAGALLVTREVRERIPAPTVPIISKVGAGDSMVAGIVLSLARGMQLRQAVRFGVAAGAAAVMTPGSELCRREDTERLYARMGSLM